MQASTAAEVTVQLLLHGSHKWIYRPNQPPRPRPTNTVLLQANERQPAAADRGDGHSIEAPAEPREAHETSLDDILEEEVDAEEARASDVPSTSPIAADSPTCDTFPCMHRRSWMTHAMPVRSS